MVLAFPLVFPIVAKAMAMNSRRRPAIIMGDARLMDPD